MDSRHTGSRLHGLGRSGAMEYHGRARWHGALLPLHSWPHTRRGTVHGRAKEEWRKQERKGNND